MKKVFYMCLVFLCCSVNAPPKPQKKTGKQLQQEAAAKRAADLALRKESKAGKGGAAGAGAGASGGRRYSPLDDFVGLSSGELEELLLGGSVSEQPSVRLLDGTQVGPGDHRFDGLPDSIKTTPELLKSPFISFALLFFKRFDYVGTLIKYSLFEALASKRLFDLAGPHKTDLENNFELLFELLKNPLVKRHAETLFKNFLDLINIAVLHNSQYPFIAQIISKEVGALSFALDNGVAVLEVDFKKPVDFLSSVCAQMDIDSEDPTSSRVAHIEGNRFFDGLRKWYASINALNALAIKLALEEKRDQEARERAVAERDACDARHKAKRERHEAQLREATEGDAMYEEDTRSKQHLLSALMIKQHRDQITRQARHARRMKRIAEAQARARSIRAENAQRLGHQDSLTSKEQTEIIEQNCIIDEMLRLSTEEFAARLENPSHSVFSVVDSSNWLSRLFGSVPLESLHASSEGGAPAGAGAGSVDEAPPMSAWYDRPEVVGAGEFIPLPPGGWATVGAAHSSFAHEAKDPHDEAV